MVFGNKNIPDALKREATEQLSRVWPFGSLRRRRAADEATEPVSPVRRALRSLRAGEYPVADEAVKATDNPVQGTVPERRPVRVLEAGDYLVIGAAQGEAASPADGDEALSDYVSASALIPESIERLDALREEEGKSATSKVSLQTADSASSSFAEKYKWDDIDLYTDFASLARCHEGEVNRAIHIPSGKLVAMKTVRMDKPRFAKAFVEEAEVLTKKLKRHTNIVEQYTHIQFEEMNLHSIVLEYCYGGDMYGVMDFWHTRKRQPIPEMFFLHFIASMSEALGYLHLGRRYDEQNNGSVQKFTTDEGHKCVLHRDIKLENIFLRWRSSTNKYGLPDIVLGDFGTAEYETETKGAFGTLGYFPPELLDRNNQLKGWITTSDHRHQPVKMTRACDIYAFGMSMRYLIDWRMHSEKGLQEAFKRSNISHWEILLDFIKSCISSDPKDRPLTETAFNWAGFLKAHVWNLYKHGARMPKISWPRPAPEAPSLHKVDGPVPRSSDGLSAGAKAFLGLSNQSAIPKGLHIGQHPANMDKGPASGVRQSAVLRSRPNLSKTSSQVANDLKRLLGVVSRESNDAAEQTDGQALGELQRPLSGPPGEMNAAATEQTDLARVQSQNLAPDTPLSFDENDKEELAVLR